MSTTYNSAGDSEDEFDWEEVPVPEAQHLEPDAKDQVGPSTRPNIEVTLEAHPAKGKDGTQPSGGISHAERLLRVDCHKVHTVALMANASTRNAWINDELLQARLLSLTPLAIQNSFAMIHKSRIPDAVKRGYLFEQAVSRLASWWADTFFTVMPTGHLRSCTFEDIQRVLHSRGLVDITGKGKGKALTQGDDALEGLPEDGEAEVVRSAKSLMKHALMRSGSRDVSSQLFTALCRALGIPTRLVVSLQSVPWQTNVGRPKTPAKPKGANSKGKTVERRDAEDSDKDTQEGRVSRKDGHSSGDDMQVDGAPADKTPSGSTNGRANTPHTVKLRKTKSVEQKLGSPRLPKPSNPLRTPPIFWTEVFSRPDGRWLPVDPIRAVVNKRKVFDPTPTGTSLRPATVDNRMIYVLAVEEDGYMRDVTPRYAKQYSTKVAKVQSGGRGRQEWWARVLQVVTRPYKLHRDDVEDDELVVNQFTEGMPTTLSGFKDHPFYVLERHLLRDQIISSDAAELGKFRGESVYSRSQVLQLKAAENWMRHGRVVRTGEQPLKYVKQRAATLNRRRELEIRVNAEGTNGSGDAMQGLYAERQTERYIPPPVIDGRVPKNSFGNIDLYTPSMLPAGAAHIPHKGAAKIARQLGFDYAEAVTSFEFRKGKAFPVISGVVVAAENEDIILEAYWEAEHVAAQKEQEKRQQAALKRWTKLVHGLRIRQRMREEYGASVGGGGGVASTLAAVEDSTNRDEDDGAAMSTAWGGGFLMGGVEDVVQHYSLPRPTHATAAPAPAPAAAPDLLLLDNSDGDGGGDEEGSQSAPGFLPGGSARSPSPASGRGRGGDGGSNDRGRGGGGGTRPKTMAELAAEMAEVEMASPSPTKGEEATRASVSSASAPASSRHRTAPKTKARLKPKPKPKPKPKTEQTQLRGRKRARGARARDEDASDAESVGDEDEDDEDGGDGEDGDSEKPRVAKRPRTRTQIRKQQSEGVDVGVVPVVPASDRVLRARKGKSAEQVAREREQELAVKRAMAG
ncbi:hypothetical protein BJV78DRAFT_1131036 [Lactifluus subvellereus]|nr:hypothetical protein BJV78DRAFT_1131036 [Lactifluus subvellereus]